MLKQLKFLVHQVNEAGHSGLVSLVDRCLESSSIPIAKLSRSFFAVGFHPSRVSTAVANEIQALSNQEDFLCKVLGDDAWNHDFV